MEFLHNILDNTEYAGLMAFILGVITAISPCPLATNITAIGFISKDLENKKMVFVRGLIYTLGRGIAYMLVGLLFFLVAQPEAISNFFLIWGEKLLGPIMLLIGIFMLDIIKIRFPGLGKMNDKLGENSKKSLWSVLFLGIAFALAFCPHSGVIFFGMFIPLTMSADGGIWLPLLFALGTGLPVVIFAWLIAFSMSSIGHLYNKIKVFETWFRRVISILFIGVGIYYTILQF
jgi:cytochrome c-type biogenesis protein